MSRLSSELSSNLSGSANEASEERRCKKCGGTEFKLKRATTLDRAGAGARSVELHALWPGCRSVKTIQAVYINWRWGKAWTARLYKYINGYRCLAGVFISVHDISTVRNLGLFIWNGWEVIPQSMVIYIP